MEYQIRQLLFNDGDKSLQNVADLQNIVYSGSNHKFTPQGFRFWYLDNPMGKVISFNAFYKEQLVAHYACIPIKMKIGGRVSSGLLDMATVTHPEHRGKGLFKRLAQTTYEYAKENGYEFVIGVANANSFPGYMKYFPFTFIGQLDVKWGINISKLCIPDKTYSLYWDKNSVEWRFKRSKYFLKNNSVYGTYNNYPFIKTLMGLIPAGLCNNICIRKSYSLLRPFNLYVGLGLDMANKFYFNIPKFIKRSPFNLIFMDLTDGKLPKITKDNIFFQLMDFDVA